ncbi:glycine cleavage system protein H, partial [Tyzzerella sp. OttesenSCG-928-J15]|nr:glycine cleavage system protein H [Tyzzerella sp. OttesenSCG-928-J15]
EGDEVEIGVAACDVESVKAVSDIISPVSGSVSEINEELLDSPGKINAAPFDAWLFKVENVSETEELMTQEEYEAFCNEEA